MSAPGVLDALIGQYEQWTCLREFATDDWHAMHIRGRIGGRSVEIVDLMRHNSAGQVSEMRLHGRPLADTAGFAVVAPDLARTRGRTMTAFIVAGLARLLPRLLAVSDRMLIRAVLGTR